MGQGCRTRTGGGRACSHVQGGDLRWQGGACIRHSIHGKGSG